MLFKLSIFNLPICLPFKLYFVREREALCGRGGGGGEGLEQQTWEDLWSAEGAGEIGQAAVGPASLSIGWEGRLLDLISDPRKGIAQVASLSGL